MQNEFFGFLILKALEKPQNSSSSRVPGTVFSSELNYKEWKAVNNSNSTIWYKHVLCMSVGQELGKEFWKDTVEKKRCAPSWRKAQWGKDSLRELSRAKCLKTKWYISWLTLKIFRRQDNLSKRNQLCQHADELGSTAKQLLR